MKILLIGSGAREHAIAEKLAESGYEPKIYAGMDIRNPGICKTCKKTGGEISLIKITDAKEVAEIAEKFGVDFVFIGPEEPQFFGVVDEVWKKGIPCIGAKRGVAEIEMSKAYMRRLMWKYGISGRLRFKAFKNMEDALAYIKEYAESLALKPARQAGGKGVKVIADLQAYLQKEKKEVKEIHAKKIFDEHMKGYDDIEERILLEEKVEGPEYTLQCFTDGKSVLGTPLVEDNKHAYEEDIGPETGGMGSISGRNFLLPFITRTEYKRSLNIVRKMIESVQKETGEKYMGLVSGQMMLTDKWGPTIIEMYSRLGDPEGVNILCLLKSDLVEICEGIISQKLNKMKLVFSNYSSVVKCVAPEGYPNFRELAKGHPIQINFNIIKRFGARVFWGSVDEINGKNITAGSRACEIFASAETIPKASEIAEKCVSAVRLTDGWGLFHRTDIGSADMIFKRKNLGKQVREIYQYREKKGILGKTIDWIPGRGRIGD